MLSSGLWPCEDLQVDTNVSEERTAYKCMWCYNTEDQHRHLHRRENLKLWVCTGPGLVEQIMLGSGPGSNDRTQTLYRTFRAFSGHSFFAKKKLFVVAIILCSWHSRAPEMNPIDLIFSGIFVAAPSQKCSRWHLTNLASDIFAPFLKRQNNLRYS
jgi:hypothetical protein